MNKKLRNQKAFALFERKEAKSGFKLSRFVCLPLLFISFLANAQNVAPTISPGAVTLFEDNIYTFKATDFSFKYNDANGDPINKIIFTTLPSASLGVLKLSGTPITTATEILAAQFTNLTYEPALNVNDVNLGGPTINWRASDGTVYSVANTFKLNVSAVNDAPVFTKGANQTVNEDAGAQTVTNWATSIAKGPPLEATEDTGESVAFTVTNDNNALFSVQPIINNITGTLTYTPAANASGLATVTVILKDNGGTANGGVNTAPAQTFTITVNAVNDPPIANADTYSVNEDGTVTLTPLANDIDPDNTPTISSINGVTLTGAAQSIAVTNGTVNINAGGTITFTPALNFNSSVTFPYVITDGTTTATANITITVNAVNDAPSFIKGADQTINEDAAAQTVNGWATAISKGPADESGQVLNFWSNQQ